MRDLAAWAARPAAQALVVALGVDAAGGDPESPLDVTADGYRAARAARSARSACRPWSCRRAAMTWTDRALVLEALAGIEEGARG